MLYSVFVSCAKGLEYLLQDELTALGLKVDQVSPFGVYGEGSLATLYQLCLWSRLANRVQLILFSGEAHNEQSLYKLCFNLSKDLYNDCLFKKYCGNLLIKLGYEKNDNW